MARVVPTLTEVLDAADWQAAERVEIRPDRIAGMASPESLDEELRRSIAAAVDAAMSELREQLSARLETLVLEHLRRQRGL